MMVTARAIWQLHIPLPTMHIFFALSRYLFTVLCNYGNSTSFQLVHHLLHDRRQ